METLRPLLTAYAYNISGSLETAKDIVQDTYLQFMGMDSDGIRDKRAYLIRMVINRAINEKNRQQRARAAYPGEWLPEPVATESADTSIHRKDILSYSLMVLLERLNARQRAVFILKEAFDYEHTEIANVLGISADHSRQLLKRAKKQLEAERVINDSSIPPRDYLDRYMDVIRSGDTQRLEQLLNEDITVISDGGGKAVAGVHPIHGKPSATALLLGMYRKFYADAHIEAGAINHQPALFYFAEGRIVTCQVFSFQNGVVDRVYIIRNPDKLKALQKIS